MSDYIDRTAEVLIQHTRTSIEGCHCGWSDLGQSHAEHVARALDAAGLLRHPDDPEVEIEKGRPMPDRIVHTHDGQRITVGHGHDCLLVHTDDWACVLTSEQAHRLATALHVQADMSEEVAADADA